MIPKIIHRIIGRKPSPLVVHCINSWETVKQHGFEIMIWTDPLLEEFMAENYPFILPAFKAARNYGEASDIGRYLIAYHYGGYYFDWDTELLNLNKFLELHAKNPNGFLVQDPVNNTLSPDTFSSLPGEKYLYKLLNNIAELQESGVYNTLKTIDYTGPYRMREVFYFTKRQTAQSIIKPKDILLYDFWEIRNQPYRDEEVAMIHYWEHGWMKPQPSLVPA